MGESRTIKSQTVTMRSAVERGKTYRWSINVKPKGNPFTDGDNYWVDAPTREEAIRQLQQRERLDKHDFIVYGRR